MNDFIIRFALQEDIPNIMQFIENYWKKDHILAKDRKLFNWQYINYNKVNFVLGIDTQKKIQGILGYISYDNIKEKNIALALWKANPCSEKPFLGMELLMFLIEKEPHESIVCTGINLKTTSKIYQHIGMTVGTMQHWYRLRKTNEYVIAKIINPSIPVVSNSNEYNLKYYSKFKELEKEFDFDLYKKSGTKPYKSSSYFSKRYFNHPIYKYLVFGIAKEDNISAIFVLRIQEYNKSKAIRFIDFIGDINSFIPITQKIDELLLKLGAEYVDLYETGLPDKILYNAGWLLVKESGNIIPNYFSPYEQRNIDIYYCSDSNVILFRGDGDQDRPS